MRLIAYLAVFAAAIAFTATANSYYVFIMATLALTAITWLLFHLLFQKLVHIQFEAGVIQSLLGL